MVYLQERTARAKQHMPSGDFKTGYCAEFGIQFPGYPCSELANFQPDVFFAKEDGRDPCCDLISGTESPAASLAILGFSGREVSLSGLPVPVRLKDEISTRRLENAEGPRKWVGHSDDQERQGHSQRFKSDTEEPRAAAEAAKRVVRIYMLGTRPLAF